MRAPIPTPEGLLPAQAAIIIMGCLFVFLSADDRYRRRRTGAPHCGGLRLRSSLCAETTVTVWGEAVFLAFGYGVMYVLSFATMITVVASAVALAALLVMMGGRSIWRLVRKGPHSNFVNNRLASACDSRQPIAELGTCQLAGIRVPR